MDNKNKQLKLFGTPLSKDNDTESKAGDDVGPVNRRRARLDRQQTVHDEQGRRRFHGAFTGGYSAGYYNSVDSAQGFRPKSFSSHRRDKKDDIEGMTSSIFDHRPEDYMDEEDFSEFGIAPKKVRLVGGFSSSSQKTAAGRQDRVALVSRESIGEKILRCMSHRRRAKNNTDDEIIHQKTDFHGLGYEPLARRDMSLGAGGYSHDPLVASLKGGKRIKISGEAFGEGVLDDDEDNLHSMNVYGLDKISDYELSRAKSTTIGRTEKPQGNLNHGSSDRHLLDGFVLADDLDALNICDNECLKYPMPIIEDGWQMPQRSEPIVIRAKPADLLDQNLISSKKQSYDLNAKFVGSTSRQTKCDIEIEGRSGLVPYSDLKEIEAKTKSSSEVTHDSIQTGVTIKRQVVEWRPCSLLCKHFGVPNPYPDNAYCGVRPSDLSTSGSLPTGDQSTVKDKTCRHKLAPIELRKSIFNIVFNDSIVNSVSESSEDDEDEPQVVNTDPRPEIIDLDVQYKCPIEGTESRRACDRQVESDQESDIVLVELPKPAPEIIVLSSSASESGCDSQTKDEGEDNDNDDDDAYGPPLPPTRETLKDLGHFSSKFHQKSSKTSSSGKHKHKKSKRSSKDKKSKR